MAGGDLPGEKPRGVGKVLGKASDHPWGLKVRWADGTTESIHIEDLEFVDA